MSKNNAMQSKTIEDSDEKEFETEVIVLSFAQWQVITQIKEHLDPINQQLTDLTRLFPNH